jgi:bacteriorhodopsin
MKLKTEFFWIFAGLATAAYIFFLKFVDTGPVGLAIEPGPFLHLFLTGAYFGFIIGIGIRELYHKIYPEAQ